MPQPSATDKSATHGNRAVYSLALVLGAYGLGASKNVIADILPEFSNLCQDCSLRCRFAPRLRICILLIHVPSHDLES